MKKNTTVTIITLMILYLLGMANIIAEETTFHISPRGNDAWSGRLAEPNADKTDGPFATFSKAQTAVRQLGDPAKRTGSVTVLIKSGTYLLDKGLTFEPADSGSAEYPTLWSAAPGEKPIIIGGKQLTGFTTHKDGIYKTNVNGQGFKDIYFRQLFMDGRRQRLARYPNYDFDNPYGGGWAYADGKYVPMYQEIPGEDRHSFTVKPEDVRNWSRPEELEVFVFPRYNWWNNICPVKSWDANTRKIILGKDASYPIRPTDRYYFQNAMEELDAPGEWYLDQKTGTLYLRPDDDCSLKTLNTRSVIAPIALTIFTVKPGTKYLYFRGLTLECAVKSAFAMTDASHCRVTGCTIRNTGDYHSTAVYFSGGKNCRIDGCDLYEIGSTAISLHGGDRKTLTPTNHCADNNYIHHTGVFYKQGVGISLSGVGSRASHNLIHDCPRFGIGFGGNNHVIEYNEIRHVNLETCDTGAIYTGGRDWLGSRGTQIRYNYFHDILGYGYVNGKWCSPHFSWGIYLDDNTGGVDVYGNIVTRCLRGLIHLHNGRDNHVMNNIFVDGTLQQFEANGWTKGSSSWTNHYPTMVKGYESVAGLPAWEKMRNMKLHPKDAPLSDGKTMSGNVVERNIFYYHPSKTGKYVGLRNFSFTANKFDYNVIWNQGKPVLTGQILTGEPIGEIPFKNGDFEKGIPGEFPKNEWGWQEHPSNHSKAELTDQSPYAGKMSLRLHADYNEQSHRGKTPILCSKGTKLQPGKTYQIRGMFRADEDNTRVDFYIHYYVPGKYWGNPYGSTVGKTWKELKHTFRIPAPGEPGYVDGMDTFKISLGNPSKNGVSIYADQISILEMNAIDEWQAWQKHGMDIHSIIADPMFEDAAHDNYRLKPESPAFKMGFKQIPTHNIGPYKSDRRASWPIIQAEGAREKPLSGSK